MDTGADTAVAIIFRKECLRHILYTMQCKEVRSKNTRQAMSVERISSFLERKKRISPGSNESDCRVCSSQNVYAAFRKRQKGQTAVWKQLSSPVLIHHYNSTTTGSGFYFTAQCSPKRPLKQAENN